MISGMGAITMRMAELTEDSVLYSANAQRARQTVNIDSHKIFGRRDWLFRYRPNVPSACEIAQMLAIRRLYLKNFPRTTDSTDTKQFNIDLPDHPLYEQAYAQTPTDNTEITQRFRNQVLKDNLDENSFFDQYCHCRPDLDHLKTKGYPRLAEGIRHILNQLRLYLKDRYEHSFLRHVYTDDSITLYILSIVNLFKIFSTGITASNLESALANRNAAFLSSIKKYVNDVSNGGVFPYTITQDRNANPIEFANNEKQYLHTVNHIIDVKMSELITHFENDTKDLALSHYLNALDPNLNNFYSAISKLQDALCFPEQGKENHEYCAGNRQAFFKSLSENKLITIDLITQESRRNPGHTDLSRERRYVETMLKHEIFYYQLFINTEEKDNKDKLNTAVKYYEDNTDFYMHLLDQYNKANQTIKRCFGVDQLESLSRKYNHFMKLLSLFSGIHILASGTKKLLQYIGILGIANIANRIKYTFFAFSKIAEHVDSAIESLQECLNIKDNIQDGRNNSLLVGGTLSVFHQSIFYIFKNRLVDVKKIAYTIRQTINSIFQHMNDLYNTQYLKERKTEIENFVNTFYHVTMLGMLEMISRKLQLEHKDASTFQIELEHSISGQLIPFADASILEAASFTADSKLSASELPNIDENNNPPDCIVNMVRKIKNKNEQDRLHEELNKCIKASDESRRYAFLALDSLQNRMPGGMVPTHNRLDFKLDVVQLGGLYYLNNRLENGVSDELRHFECYKVEWISSFFSAEEDLVSTLKEIKNALSIKDYDKNLISFYLYHYQTNSETYKNLCERAKNLYCDLRQDQRNDDSTFVLDAINNYQSSINMRNEAIEMVLGLYNEMIKGNSGRKNYNTDLGTTVYVAHTVLKMLEEMDNLFMRKKNVSFESVLPKADTNKINSLINIWKEIAKAKLNLISEASLFTTKSSPIAVSIYQRASNLKEIQPQL